MSIRTYVDQMTKRNNRMQVGEQLLAHICQSGPYRSTGREILAKSDRYRKLAKAMIHSSMNVNQAARLLYVHRNTAARQVERFRELSGIDLQTFSGALYCYAALLSLGEVIAPMKDRVSDA